MLTQVSIVLTQVSVMLTQGNIALTQVSVVLTHTHTHIIDGPMTHSTLICPEDSGMQ